jgi:prepilin-type N-terminal cleavage/methylation domain-containing protein
MTRPVASERGFTLIELLVYVSLFVVILTVAGGILINSLSVEKAVRNSTGAATLGQLLSQSMSQSVRNATAITVTADAEDATDVARTQLLVLETTTNGAVAQPQCHAWLYVPLHGGQLFSARSNKKIPIPSVAYLEGVPADQPISAPAGWASYGEGIIPKRPESVIFTQKDQSVSFTFLLTLGREITEERLADLTDEELAELTDEVSGVASSHQSLRSESTLCF